MSARAPIPPRRILLVQLRRIGDAVLLLPSMEALGEAWPRASIHLLTEGPIPDLFRGDDRLHVVWVRPPRAALPDLVRRLRRERFDLVLDFQSLPLTAVLTRALGTFSVGYRRRWRTAAYTVAVDLARHAGTDYAADHKLDLVRVLLPEARLRPVRLAPGDAVHAVWEAAGNRPRAVLVPVSRRPHKRWAPEAFAAAMTLLHRRTGAFAVLAGGPGEGEVLTEVASRLDGVPHRVHTCSTLAEFATLVRGAHLFLGNDNGPRHLAVGAGIPTVAWFGDQNPTHWTPPGDRRHVVLWNRNRARGRPVREDLCIVPDDPRSAAEAAVDLLRAAVPAR